MGTTFGPRMFTFRYELQRDIDLVHALIPPYNRLLGLGGSRLGRPVPYNDSEVIPALSQSRATLSHFYLLESSEWRHIDELFARCRPDTIPSIDSSLYQATFEEAARALHAWIVSLGGQLRNLMPYFPLVPEHLLDWTLESITALLDNNIPESDTFDYKESLPRAVDPKALEDQRHKLRVSISSFANTTHGGFLIYGVRPDAALPTSKRLIGLPPNPEFARDFGDQARSCHPPVAFQLSPTLISLPDGNVIYVVFIMPSPRAPHAAGSPERGYFFGKRTSRGKDYMSIDEVRASFLGYYEKRLKLQLLDAELADIERQCAEILAHAGTFRASDDELIVPFTCDIRTIESVVEETYAVTAHATKLHASLIAVRHASRQLEAAYFRTNTRIGVRKYQYFSNVQSDHYKAVRPVCETLLPHLRQARDHLKPLLMP